YFYFCLISAPVYDDDQIQPHQQETQLDYYTETEGCYFNFQHYNEGDRIITSEPCLNCTCHNHILMCYLRVCPPFTKAIGQDCTIEKKPEQCCPVITCPEVPVHLLTSSTTAITPPTPTGSTSAVGHPDNYGCTIDNLFYTDGAQVPGSPSKPCELCYCIRNKTACVMQECTLQVEGCRPVFQPGICCPVRYDCDYIDTTEYPQLPETTIRPTPGMLLTTTMPGPLDCRFNDEIYADGARIESANPCEHCYCMRGDIMCALQECGTPLEREGKNCTALPPQPGQCCPEQYQCDNEIRHVNDLSLRQNRKHDNDNGTLPFESLSHEKETTPHPPTATPASHDDGLGKTTTSGQEQEQEYDSQKENDQQQSLEHHETPTLPVEDQEEHGVIQQEKIPEIQTGPATEQSVTTQRIEGVKQPEITVGSIDKEDTIMTPDSLKGEDQGETTTEEGAKTSMEGVKDDEKVTVPEGVKDEEHVITTERIKEEQVTTSEAAKHEDVTSSDVNKDEEQVTTSEGIKHEEEHVTFSDVKDEEHVTSSEGIKHEEEHVTSSDVKDEE
ncbi:hypothetical protein C0J52_21202, partial [Blattella germanica]